MMAMPNDLAIMFGRVRVAMPVTPSPEGGGIALNEPACVLQMSYQSAKDLHVLLGDALTDYEKDWGTINTEFVKTKKR